MKIEQAIEASIASAIKELYGTEVEASLTQLQKTRKEFKGHLTLVTFPFLKISRKSPEQTAQEIGEWLSANSPYISGFNVVKGFLNLEIAGKCWLELLSDINSLPEYGIIRAADNSPLVMIEYSSPNTNKPLHLGHIRNNLLGYSISEILQANGNRVVKTNIVNDRGIHICKSMLAWKKWGNGETPESTGEKGDHLVGKFYVLFDKHYREELKNLQEQGLAKEEAEAKSSLMAEAREMLRLWENGDKDTVELWKKMNSWVYAGFDETYKVLGVNFDKIYYESETYLNGKDEVLRGLEEGTFFKKEDNSVWADLTGEGPKGMGRMKSREGTVVDADDLVEEMVVTARETSDELGKLDNCTEGEANNIARIVGLGALKYFILKVDPKKNMVFNPKESIDFNGNTGPFIQYTYARIQSVLRKAAETGINISDAIDNSIQPTEKEESLIQLLAEFAAVVKQAGDEYSPAIIANYIYELVKEYNQFYHDHSILKEENGAIRNFRLILSLNVSRTVQKGMQLLGIEVPDRM